MPHAGHLNGYAISHCTPCCAALILIQVVSPGCLNHRSLKGKAQSAFTDARSWMASYHHRSVGFTDVLPCSVGSHSTHAVKTLQHSNQQRSKTVSCAKPLSSPRLLLAVQLRKSYSWRPSACQQMPNERSPVTQLRNAQCGCLSPGTARRCFSAIALAASLLSMVTGRCRQRQ